MLERLKSINLLFVLTVIVPTLLSVIYFGLLAEDVYTSESRIVVRNPSETAASPLSAALNQTGFGSVGEGNDSVIEYLGSRQAISAANTDGLLINAYSGDEIFVLDRFGGLWGNSAEHFFEYFGGKLTVQEGTTTQVMTITVRAFDAKTAQAINERLVRQSEELVNSLSARSSADSIKVAQGEVDEATEQARSAALELADFRDRNGIVDPVQQAEVGLQMISKLQDQLISAQTRLRQLRTYTPQASQIPFLQTQVRDLEAKIKEARRELVGGTASLSSAMAKFQELQLNSEFAEKQLAVVLASLQEAKAEARRKRAYVEQIAEPSLPDYAIEPRRIRSILATLVMGLLAWGVLYMLMIGVREHKD